MVSDGRAKRNWLHHSAIGLGATLLVASLLGGLLWIWLKPSTTLIPERQKAQQHNTEYQAASGPCDPKRLAAITRKVARADQERACAKEEKDDAREDYAATQAFRVTNATEEALRLARDQADVAFAQAILTALAVAFTGWAAVAAARAAKAAHDSVEDARLGSAAQSEQFRLQLAAAQEAADAYRQAERAWMGLVSISFLENTGELEGEQGKCFSFAGRFVNSGRTPANNVRCFSEQRVFRKNDTVKLNFSVPYGPFLDRRGVIVPNTFMNSKSHYIDFSDTKAMMDGEILVILWCKVTYEDTLSAGIERVTETCFEITCNGRAVHNVTGQQTPNFTYSLVGPHNFAT